MTPIVGAKTIQKAAESRNRRTISRSTRSSRSEAAAATELTDSSLVGPEADEVVDHPDEKNGVNGDQPFRDDPVALLDPGEFVAADLRVLVLLFVRLAHPRASLPRRARLIAFAQCSSGRGRSGFGCSG